MNSRRDDRRGYDDPLRIDLLESDADHADHAIEALNQTVRTEVGGLRLDVHTEVGELRKQLVGLQRVLIGILVSITTAAVLLAVNIGFTQ